MPLAVQQVGPGHQGLPQVLRGDGHQEAAAGRDVQFDLVEAVAGLPQELAVGARAEGEADAVARCQPQRVGDHGVGGPVEEEAFGREACHRRSRCRG